MKGLTREDPSEIGLVKAAFICGAIDAPELRSWAENIVVTRDEYPSYILDLVEFDSPKPAIQRHVGGWASSGLTEEDRHTLGQLAFDRHGILGDGTPSDVLNANSYVAPQLVNRFVEIFRCIHGVSAISPNERVRNA